MSQKLDKPKKKVDLGAIAFMRVGKLEKRINELEETVYELKRISPKT